LKECLGDTGKALLDAKAENNDLVVELKELKSKSEVAERQLKDKLDRLQTEKDWLAKDL